MEFWHHFFLFVIVEKYEIGAAAYDQKGGKIGTKSNKNCRFVTSPC